MKSKDANSLPDGRDRFSRFLYAPGDAPRQKIPAEVMHEVRVFIPTRAALPAQAVSPR